MPADKTTLFLMMEDVLLCRGCSSPTSIKEFRKDSRVLERSKMWALYSDYEQEEFYAPGEVIPEWLAKQALDLARKRVGLARDFESIGDWSRTIRTMKKQDVDKFRAFVVATSTGRKTKAATDTRRFP